ncbi:ribonuclease S-2-like [Vicia villosa]|uniref:ribonuclease S-2-like n=1 Tax=Vicia villosa TaxID=3911 RepID=UPI00273CB292|nr:ribonuclease S-2-like [Vicia villosa]
MMKTTMTLMITITILFHTFFYIGFSNDEALITTLSQLPTSLLPSFDIYHQISNPYSSHEPLENSKNKSPPSPPPPPPPLLFDHFVLSQTWPPTYCKIKNNDCVSPKPLKFVIHGLWPSKKNGDPVRDCHKVDINLNELVPIKEKLVKDWPALYKKVHQDDANFALWVDQWNAHGTCSIQLFKFFSYFEETLKVYNRNSIKDIFKKYKINPGKKYLTKTIFDAIHTEISFKPQIRCEQLNELDYLYEIRLCFKANVELEYKDCDISYSGCRGQEVNF